MKTAEFLRIDLAIQYTLAGVNLLLIIAGFIDAQFWSWMLFNQIFLNIYHFITNSLHLKAQHRSVGFSYDRKRYMNLCLAYVPIGCVITILLVYLWLLLPLLCAGMLFVMWFVIPQIVLHRYIYLCKKEVDFIEQNEFHILK